MLKSIVQKNRFTSPISESEKKILHSAIKLFLENGYSVTTLKMISEECKMSQGTITYHFHTKEDMLYILVQALMDFHGDVIENINTEVNDPLVAYAMEVAAQISICDENEKAWDLYYSAYTHPATFIHIKDWASKKAYWLLKNRLPQWNEASFREVENVASCIELSAFTMQKSRELTLERKIYLVLNSLMKIYNIPKEDRVRVIETVLKADYRKIGQDMFDNLVKKLDDSEK